MSNPHSAPVRPTPSLPASARITVIARPPERHSISDGVVAPIDHQRPSVASVPIAIEDASAELSIGDDTACITLPAAERPTVMHSAVSAAITTPMPVASAHDAAPSAAVTAAFVAQGSSSTPTLRARGPHGSIAVSAPRPAARCVFPAVPAPPIGPAMYPVMAVPIQPIVPSTAPVAARLPLPAPTPSRGVALAQGSIPPPARADLVNTSARTLGAAGHAPMHAARGERRSYGRIPDAATTTPMRASHPPAEVTTIHLTGPHGAPMAAIVDAKTIHVPVSAQPPVLRGASLFTESWFAAARRVSPTATSAMHARERRLAWIYLIAGLLLPLLAPIGWVHAEEQVERFSDRLFRVERFVGLVLTLISVAILACALTVLLVR